MSAKIFNGEFEYIELKSGIRITKYVGAAASVTIPAKIDGKPVTDFDGETFGAARGKLKSVEILGAIQIPDSVTKIVEVAFENCHKEIKIIRRD